MLEIERKFIIKELPNLENRVEIKYERFFLEISLNKEVRIQKKWDMYEKEVKTKINQLTFEKTKQEISQEEFL